MAQIAHLVRIRAAPEEVYWRVASTDGIEEWFTQASSPDYRKGGQTHTSGSANPWWEIDLGGERAVEKVQIWNRKGMEHRLDGFTLRFLDANREARVEGRAKQSGKLSYFRGKDPEKWRSGLSTYREVVYRGLWPDPSA